MLYYNEALSQRESAATLGFRGLQAGADLAAVRIYPLSTGYPEGFDPRAYRFVDAGTAGSAAEGYRVDWQPAERPLASVKSTFKQVATERRYAAETGGIMVGGHAIRTDRESRGLIASAAKLAEADPSAPVDFKAASGWVVLDAATMQDIALAVGRHVRECFRRERELHEAIDGAEAVVEVLTIDLTAGWP